MADRGRGRPGLSSSFANHFSEMHLVVEREDLIEEERQRYNSALAPISAEEEEGEEEEEPEEEDKAEEKEKGDEGEGKNNPNDNTEIPEEYLYDPFAAEPSLDNLRSIDPQTGTLQKFLAAADADVLLHGARIRAVLLNDPSLLQTYNPENDDTYINRRNRNALRDVEVRHLREEARKIMRDIDLGPTSQHMTAHEISRERMDRWQRALELYVHCPDDSDVDLLGLLEKLCEGCSEEEELSEALSQASQMCTSLVEQTSLAVRDATEDAAEAEDAYHIRLEAHSILARRVCEQSDAIEEQFRTNGRAALKIGQQLELAEAKRRQCESASILIKRWWIMEGLAEQEDLSGEEIQVNEEVRGLIPSSSCRMDPLFTKPENSLEAAKALKALRTVVKSRGSSASGSLLDPTAIRRFELTSGLIQRTSAALEARLLNSFSEIYTAGGVYDFSSEEAASRSGRLNWVLLRELAEALMCFDSGRSLQKRYVHMVVTSRFPELFNNVTKNNVRGNNARDSDDDGSDEEDDDEGEFDADETRSKLSSLFHRVTEVCTAEFSLIAHVFGTSSTASSTSITLGYDSIASSSSGADTTPLQVVRALLQRVISDPRNGLQARINDLLESIDKRGDFLAGAKKLDTFVVIHEKAAGLFTLLKESAEQMLIPMAKDKDGDRSSGEIRAKNEANARAVSSLVQFLTSQEIALSDGHRRGYLNLELRLLHHECCNTLVNVGGAKMLKPRNIKEGPSRLGRLVGGGDANNNKSGSTAGGLAEYRAPVMPLDKGHLKKGGFPDLLNGPLKQAVLRQPLIHATDSLARARLMFGGGQGGGGYVDSTARVITAIYSQMCVFYGQSFLFPIIESLGEMLDMNPPSTPPSLPFAEDGDPHNLGVDESFWVCIERIHTAAKSFDRELWAEQREGSVRVWEILVGTGSITSMTLAKDRRLRFFQELEERGEAAILRALDTLSTHIQWILVTGGESMLATGGKRLLSNMTGQSNGPYAIPAGSSLEATNSPAVKALTYCLRAQFIQIQNALTPQSSSAFWTALSMRLYDILCARLLQHYYVSTVGAVILSRDVEALRSVAMLTGTDHSHWDMLRELLTLYMTPPDSLKSMLVGPDGDVNSAKGLFVRAGKDQSLVFMSRRVDYRIKTNQGMKKCAWALDLLEELGVQDPTDGPVNIGLYSAENQRNRS